MGDVMSSLAAKFAFFPPSPPSYRVVESGRNELRMTDVPERGNVDVLKLKTKRGTEIVAVYVKNPAASMTVLYSHGNAADLGQMYEYFCELGLYLRVNLTGPITGIRKLYRLRAERQEKIDEPIIIQLIQKYDTDPAAKVAAAFVLPSKLGADSGLKVYLGDELQQHYSEATGKSHDAEPVNIMTNETSWKKKEKKLKDEYQIQ